MPNWKKLIVSGSDATLNNLNVTNAVTASYFKGDGSALTNVTTTIAEIASKPDTFSNTTSKVITHNFGSKDVIVSVFDSTDNLIIPESIVTTDDNNITITFAENTTGRAVVARGGHIVSGSVTYTQLSNVPEGIVSSSQQLPSGIISSSQQLPSNIVSSSTQLSSDISGSFTATSASFATTIAALTSDYTELTNVPGNIVSSSNQLASDISGSVTALSGSIATRFDGLTSDYTALSNIPGGIISSSKQLPSGIISSSQQFPSNIVSSSTQVRTAVEAATNSNVFTDADHSKLNSVVTSGIVSSSLQLSSDISGSFTATSASFATTIGSLTSDYTELTNIPGNIVSSSTQLASNISGSITATSSSLASRISSNETVTAKTLISSSNQLASDISGSITLTSASLAGGRLKNTTDTLTGNLTVTGTINATKVNTTVVSSSIAFSSGSNVFGDEASDKHEFTGSIDSAGNVGMSSGQSSGKFAVMATGVHGSYDFYNNGTSYFNGAVTVDAAFTQTGGAASSFSGEVGANAFSGDGSALTNLTLPTGTVSSSLQLSSDISGSFTATSASFANTIDNLPTGDITSVTAGLGISGGGSSGAVTLTSEYLLAVDDRDMKPNTSGVGATVKGVKPFFTSLGGMTSTANTDYQDVLVLDTYSDTSGGSANALSFDKSTQLIKHWQAVQTATSWGTPKTLAYLESPSFTGNATFAGNATIETGIGLESGTLVIKNATTDSNGLRIFQDSSDASKIHNNYNGTLQLGINNTTSLTLGSSLSATFGGRVTVEGHISASGAISASAYIGDGSALTGVVANVTQEVTVTDTFSSVTSKAITHNFGTKNVIISVYDSNDQVIIPASITTTNVNVVTVTFATATSGRVVVAKGGHIVSGSIAVDIVEETTVLDTFTSSTSKAVSHNFGTKNVLVSVYDNADKMIIPQEVVTTDINTVTITLATATTGRVIVAKGGHLVSGSSEATVDFGAVGSHILPSTTEIYDLGSSSKRWRDIYLSGSTIDLGGTKITRDGDGDIEFKDSNNNLKKVRAAEMVLGSGGSQKRMKLVGGKVVTTDNSGNVEHPATASYALTASFVEDSFISASAVRSGFGAGGTDISALSITGSGFTNVSTVAVNHGFGTKEVVVSVYDNGDNLIMPSNIKTTTTGSVDITFAQPRTGRVVVSKGGHVVTSVTGFNAATAEALTAAGSRQGIVAVTSAVTASLFSTHLLRGHVSMSLPSAVAGDWVKVSNRVTSSYAHLVPGGAQKIMGSTESLQVDSNNVGFELIYADSTDGWVVIGQ